MANNDDRIFLDEKKLSFFLDSSAHEVVFSSIRWKTAEHALCALKFYHKEDIFQAILKAPTPEEAKRIAEENQQYARADWEAVKLNFAKSIRLAKLRQHPHIKEELLRSGDREIIDSSTDTFWGAGTYEERGENHSGKIWMKLRDGLSDGEYR